MSSLLSTQEYGSAFYRQERSRFVSGMAGCRGQARSARHGLVLHWRTSHPTMKIAPSHAVQVRSLAGDYSVVCQHGLLRRVAREIAGLGNFSSIHVLTSPTVWRALGPKVRRGLNSRSRAKVHLFDDRESSKKLSTVEEITRGLVRAGAD